MLAIFIPIFFVYFSGIAAHIFLPISCPNFVNFHSDMAVIKAVSNGASFKEPNHNLSALSNAVTTVSFMLSKTAKKSIPLRNSPIFPPLALQSTSFIAFVKKLYIFSTNLLVSLPKLK